MPVSRRRGCRGTWAGGPAAGATTAAPAQPGGTVVPVAGLAAIDRPVPSDLVAIEPGTATIPAKDLTVTVEPAKDGSLGARVQTTNTSVPHGLYVGELKRPDGRELGAGPPLRVAGHGGLTTVASPASSAQTRLDRLLERLLTAAEASLAAGDLEPARVTAEEVRAVDPDNLRAARILRQVAARQLGPAGERALMTVLFSDLVGSTMLSERVEPEQLRDLFAFYRTAAREAVTRYSGYVMQYLGDGILAAFGYPEPHEDDARRAVLAGLDLGVAMRDARAELDRRFGVAPEVRVGIHTGRVVVTDLSDDRSVAERDSIVGLVTNLAARIQQAAEPGTVVISDVTQQLVDADFYLHSLGERALKGISRPVEIFAVERPRYAAARFEVERYRKAGLVGRDEPRDRMLTAWADVRRATVPPAGAAFLLVGEAGIGKSRLVAEVLDRVEASGGRVLGVGCLPYYANVSLWPIARLLERVLGLAADDSRSPRPAGHPPHVARAGPGALGPVPRLAHRDSRRPRVPRSGTGPERLPRRDPQPARRVAGRARAGDAAPARRRGPALGRPVDPRAPGPARRSVPRRPAHGGHHPRPVARPVDGRRLRPPARPSRRARPPRRSSTTSRPGGALTHDRRDSVVAQAEGIPLFIEELTRSFLDETRDDTIPLRIQELFTCRLKAPGVDLRVVQVAATVGPTFDAATVSAVIGDDDAVAEQLRLLSDEGIVEPAGPATGTYRFRHALMRDAAYETQVLEVRRATHAAVADTIAAAGAEPALIAQHLDLAGAADRAAHLYGTAAQAEQARGAHLEATRLLSRALELLEGLPESDERDLVELDRPHAARAERQLDAGLRRAGRPVRPPTGRGAGHPARARGGAALADRHLGRLADQRRPDHGPRTDRPAARHGRAGRLHLVRAGGAVLRRLPRVLRGPTRCRAGPPGGRAWPASPPAPTTRPSPRSGRCPTTRSPPR